MSSRNASAAALRLMVRLSPPLVGGVFLAFFVAHSSSALADELIVGSPLGVGIQSFSRDLGDLVRQAATASVARKDFEAKIASARQSFLTQYPSGPSIAAARNDLSNILFQKDLFYLSLYAANGMSPDAVAHADALMRLAGGSLDGGIPIRASEEFEGWVESFRRGMGVKLGEPLMFPSPDRYLSTLTSEPVRAAYAVYVAKRDYAELAPWRRAHAPAIASTPEQRADRYLTMFIDPQISKNLSRLPEVSREEAKVRADKWREDVRMAVERWEGSELTLESAVAALRYLERPDDNITFFSSRMDNLRSSMTGDQAEFVLTAYNDTIIHNDLVQSHIKSNGAGRNVIESMFRSALFEMKYGAITEQQHQEIVSAVGQRTSNWNWKNITYKSYLVLCGPPDGKTRYMDYEEVRDQVISGVKFENR